MNKTMSQTTFIHANMLLGGPDFIGTNKQFEIFARKVADYVKRTKRFD